ncbi:uncharacterized protein LOC112686402 [Sipha flava]|uniref:Uncharacterized protein LOC112686402 n=1 Tax=Sipha flava TaxID=143950 RepID=A0A8B8FTZ7_9HEMI|nr:uncharacterized protein LOC112686402 [Sipha flava]
MCTYVKVVYIVLEMANEAVRLHSVHRNTLYRGNIMFRTQAVPHTTDVLGKYLSLVTTHQSYRRVHKYNCWLLARIGGLSVKLTQVKGSLIFRFNLAFAPSRICNYYM